MKERPRVEIGGIKKALEKNWELARKKGVGYDLTEEGWSEYDSPISSFSASFMGTLPVKFFRKTDFKNYIEKTLHDTINTDLAAVEFGGTGSRLFRGFENNFFKHTLGVCLKDIRNESLKIADSSINHEVIEGDIMNVLSNKLFEKVKEGIHKDKIDLIISRMSGPLLSIDKNGAILDRIIRNWYDLLNGNGLIFAEFEHRTLATKTATRDLVKKWAYTVRQKYPEIEIQVSGNALRLHKKNGSPDKLPTAAQMNLV